MSYEVYVDAAHAQDTRRGTWAAVFMGRNNSIARVESGEIPHDDELFYGPHVAELYSIYFAINLCGQDSIIEMYTDSAVAIQLLSEDKEKWASENKDIKVIRKIESLIKKKNITVTLTHIRRATNIYQSYADHYATRVLQHKKPMRFDEYRFFREESIAGNGQRKIQATNLSIILEG